MVRLAYQSGPGGPLHQRRQAADLGLLTYFDTIVFQARLRPAATYERRNPGLRFNRAIFNISRTLFQRQDDGAPHPGGAVLCQKRYSLANCRYIWIPPSA
jgi:hypothetical protein